MKEISVRVHSAIKRMRLPDILRTIADVPELVLAYAILIQAVWDVLNDQRDAINEDGTGPAAATDARDWIFGDTSDPFQNSFMEICERLRIDPGWIQRCVKEAQQTGEHFRRRPLPGFRSGRPKQQQLAA